MRTLERKLFENVLARLRGGRLTLIENGHVRVYGEDSPDALQAMVEVHSPAFYRTALFGGEIGLGEAYMDGHWSTPDLPAVVRLAIRNIAAIDNTNAAFSLFGRLLARWNHLRRNNSVTGSRENIRAHYDLSNEFFALFLDPTMMYSAALWETDGDTLEQAQFQKLDRICRLLRLSPEDHILEIGSGWGAFAIHAASRYGCRVTTTTISRQQFDLAKDRIAAAGLSGRIQILLEDYRHLTGSYTKAVSIEMFEAVGLNHYDDYFAALNRLVIPGGAILIQTITMNEANFPSYQASPDWIQKYIFPGGELSSLIEIQRSLARTGRFQLHDLRGFGLHYARTLREWRRRFHARIEDVRRLGFDQRFERMWDYYLGYCEGAFLERYISVHQLLLVHQQAPEGVHGEPWPADGLRRASGMYT
jgi:cyclopropane-fatty-acyl-phospholipid synthase